MGAGNHPRARKLREQGPGHREGGHHGGHQDPQARGSYHDGRTSALTPSRCRTTPWDARPQHTPPKSDSDAIRITPAHAHQPPETTQGRKGTPARRERATPTEEATGNTARQPTTTPSPPGDDPGHHKGHRTGTERGRRHGHSAQGWGPGPPEDTGPRHRPPGRATPRTPT